MLEEEEMTELRGQGIRKVFYKRDQPLKTRRKGGGNILCIQSSVIRICKLGNARS